MCFNINLMWHTVTTMRPSSYFVKVCYVVVSTCKYAYLSFWITIRFSFIFYYGRRQIACVFTQTLKMFGWTHTFAHRTNRLAKREILHNKHGQTRLDALVRSCLKSLTVCVNVTGFCCRRAFFFFHFFFARSSSTSVGVLPLLSSSSIHPHIYTQFHSVQFI